MKKNLGKRICTAALAAAMVGSTLGLHASAAENKPLLGDMKVQVSAGYVSPVLDTAYAEAVYGKTQDKLDVSMDDHTFGKYNAADHVTYSVYTTSEALDLMLEYRTGLYGVAEENDGMIVKKEAEVILPQDSTTPTGSEGGTYKITELTEGAATTVTVQVGDKTATGAGAACTIYTLKINRVPVTDMPHLTLTCAPSAHTVGAAMVSAKNSYTNILGIELTADFSSSGAGFADAAGNEAFRDGTGTAFINGAGKGWTVVNGKWENQPTVSETEVDSSNTELAGWKNIMFQYGSEEPATVLIYNANEFEFSGIQYDFATWTLHVDLSRYDENKTRYVKLENADVLKCFYGLQAGTSSDSMFQKNKTPFAFSSKIEGSAVADLLWSSMLLNEKDHTTATLAELDKAVVAVGADVKNRDVPYALMEVDTADKSAAEVEHGKVEGSYLTLAVESGKTYRLELGGNTTDYKSGYMKYVYVFQPTKEGENALQVNLAPAKLYLGNVAGSEYAINVDDYNAMKTKLGTVVAKGSDDQVCDLVKDNKITILDMGALLDVIGKTSAGDPKVNDSTNDYTKADVDMITVTP